MTEMTDERAAEVLAAHNEWQRYDGDPFDPDAPRMDSAKLIGRAIDHAVSRLSSQTPAEAQPVYAGVDLEGGWIRATAPAGVEDLSCCGGNDETPKSHCMDCSRYPGQLAQQPAPPSAPEGVGEPPKGWNPCSRCRIKGKSDDCERCGGSGWRKRCNALDCIEYGCNGYVFCIVTKEEVAAALAQQPAAVDGATPEGWRVMPFTGSWKACDERWEVYSPDGSGGVVLASEVRSRDVASLLDALAAQQGGSDNDH